MRQHQTRIERPARIRPGRLPALVLGLFLVFGAFAGDAAADDTVQVAAVEGKTVDEAIELLEKQGLDVRLIEVAGPKVGIVDSQDPPRGMTLRRGGIVTIRFGIKARVETKMPDVGGKPVEDALQELAAVYDVMILPVPVQGSDRPGHVVRTEPRAGSKVWFRAPVTIYVAERSEDIRPRPDQPATPPVPEVPPVAAPPTPPARGAAADLSPPGTTPRAAVRGEGMPALVGLSYAEAQRAVRARGLVPHPWFFRTDGTPWQVYTQKLGAGSPVPEGMIAHFRVILPRALPARVPTPDVVGLDVGSAIRVARDLGLPVRVRGERDVTSPDARVLAQDPAAGGELDTGASITFVVGERAAPRPGSASPDVPAPPPGLPPLQPPAGAIVTAPLAPSVVGLSVADAQAVLAKAGLTSELQDTPAPEAAPDRVFEQEPPAGLPVEDKIVRIALPEATGAPVDPNQVYAKVPDVVNQSPARAESAVNATGLRAVLERGPEVQGAPTIIIAQSHHPGALIKMGTLVTIVTGSPDGSSGAVAAPEKKDDPNTIEKVGRYFRKKQKQAWGKIKDLFK